MMAKTTKKKTLPSHLTDFEKLAGVILLLVAMLVSLVSWLRSDILHSALLLQSGLQ